MLETYLRMLLFSCVKVRQKSIEYDLTAPQAISLLDLVLDFSFLAS